MTKLKANDLRKLNDKELELKLTELRAELVKLRSAATRGTLKKETGQIGALKKSIARLLTIQNEKKFKK